MGCIVSAGDRNWGAQGVGVGPPQRAELADRWGVRARACVGLELEVEQHVLAPGEVRHIP